MTDLVPIEPPPGQGYDLQRTFAETRKDFWFRWDDRWWQLPNLQMLDYNIQLEVMSFQDRVNEDDVNVAGLKQMLDDLFDLIMDAGRDGQAAEWRAVTVRPLPMLMNMLDEWREKSGADEGESLASDASSKGSTGRPSKRTSKPSTGSGSPRRSSARQKTAVPPASS